MINMPGGKKSWKLLKQIAIGVIISAISGLIVVWVSGGGGENTMQIEDSPGSINTIGQIGNNTIDNSESLLIEEPQGNIDGMNRIFFVSHRPVYLIDDGLWRFENSGYRYSTGTIIMDIPPAFDLRSFYEK